MAHITTPVTVVTGFLGARKTTLINRVLSELHGQRMAVIENEFGATGVDAGLLVEGGAEAIVQLDNGCLCCTVRGDLARALQTLAERADAGHFTLDRVLIETTGLADPGPIVQTFLAETAILTRFHLDGVVVIVDGVHGDPEGAPIEQQAQIGYADRLLLTKRDLVPEAALQRLMQDLQALAPRAQVVPVDLLHDRLDAVFGVLFDVHGYSFDHVPRDELGRLRGMGLRLAASGVGQDTGQDAGEAGRPLSRPGRHTPRVVTCVFESAQPLDLDRLNVFFDTLMARYGRALWRFKGVVHARQARQRLVVQGVQGLLQVNGGPVWRAREPRATLLVFIGIALDTRWILAALQQCQAPAAAGAGE